VLAGYDRLQDGATVLVKIDGDGQMDPAHQSLCTTPILEMRLIIRR